MLPAESEIEDPRDLLASWPVVERPRDVARERGIYTPHPPQEWGGLGAGVLGMALISQECGVSGLASLGLNAMAPDEGNMHTLLIAGTPEQLKTHLERGGEDGHRRRRRTGPPTPPQLLAHPRADGHARMGDRAPPGVDGLARAGVVDLARRPEAMIRS